MTDKSEIAGRLRDYGVCLDPNVVICDRRVVDEAADALDRLANLPAGAEGGDDRCNCGLVKHVGEHHPFCLFGAPIDAGPNAHDAELGLVDRIMTALRISDPTPEERARVAEVLAGLPTVGEGLEKLRALSDAATPGPWRERDGYYCPIQGAPVGDQPYGDMVTTHTGKIAAQQGRGKHNTAFIVAAVNFARAALGQQEQG